MSQIPAAAVKMLRDRTNQPMMDCKAALTEANGDMDKAVDIKLSDDLARQIALQNPTSVEVLFSQPFVDDPKKKVNDRISETVGLIREYMKPARFTRLTGLLGGYVHHDGSVGVIIQVDGDRAEIQMLRDVCMHITARNPAYGCHEDVPAAVIAKEQEIAKSQIAADPKNANKPPQIIEKIAEGKLKTWFAENVLVEQPFVKDDSKSVGDLLNSNGLKMVKFIRYKVGELN
jgi:elongation factor Ts